MRAGRYFCIIFLLVALDAKTESSDYVVAENDTLWSISQKYDVSVEALKEANGINDERTLRVGMRLIVPQLYIVRKGDNLWRIARENGTSVAKIRELNSLENDEIRAGDVLVLPRVENESPGTEQKEKAISGTEETRVSVGDQTYDGVPFWPVDGVRTSKTGKISGTEIFGSQGDAVVSIASGEVVWNSTSPVFGNVIIIESSSNYLYLYSGLADTTVKYGERISAGTKIAELGVNPHTGEAKLLFSVYRDGKLVDPSVAPRG